MTVGALKSETSLRRSWTRGKASDVKVFCVCARCRRQASAHDRGHMGSNGRRKLRRKYGWLALSPSYYNAAAGRILSRLRETYPQLRQQPNPKEGR